MCDYLDVFIGRLICLVRGHNWDSERPAGPLGYEPDLCWRCEARR